MNVTWEVLCNAASRADYIKNHMASQVLCGLSVACESVSTSFSRKDVDSSTFVPSKVSKKSKVMDLTEKKAGQSQLVLEKGSTRLRLMIMAFLITRSQET